MLPSGKSPSFLACCPLPCLHWEVILRQKGLLACRDALERLPKVLSTRHPHTLGSCKTVTVPDLGDFERVQLSPWPGDLWESWGPSLCLVMAYTLHSPTALGSQESSYHFIAQQTPPDTCDRLYDTGVPRRNRAQPLPSKNPQSDRGARWAVVATLHAMPSWGAQGCTSPWVGGSFIHSFVYPVVP